MRCKCFRRFPGFPGLSFSIYRLFPLLIPQPISEVRLGGIAERSTHRRPPEMFPEGGAVCLIPEREQTAPPSGNRNERKRRRRFGSRRWRPEAGGGGVGEGKAGQGGEGA